MGRPPRVHYQGAIYHVMARGNGGQDVFVDALDYEHFLAEFHRIKPLFDFRVFAYCLMPNHFHFALQTNSAPISEIMHRLLFTYARYFNDRWKRKGHLFYERYKALHCRDDRYLVTLLRYIHRNPVKAGLAANPYDWPWSSHGKYLAPPDDSVDTTLGLTLLGGRDSYMELMELAVAPADDYDPGSLSNGATLKPSLSELMLTSPTKHAFIFNAAGAGYTARDIAAFLGCTRQNINKLRKNIGAVVS